MIKTENTWLMFGDCLERMKEISDGSVDMILTDPPYGTVRTITNHNMTGRVDWDNPINTSAMMLECYRILRPRGTMVLFAQDPYTTGIITGAHGNLPFAYRMVWQKNRFGNALIARTAPVNMFEDVCVFFKNDTDHREHPMQKLFRDELERLGLTASGLAKELGEPGLVHSFTMGKVFRIPNRERFERIQAATGGFQWGYEFIEATHEEFKASQRVKFPKVFNIPDGEKFKSNILTYDKDRTNYHPTQKPVALLSDLINTYTNPGDTVVDFTMGSGSTGVAAAMLGRQFVGIELDPTYYGVACERVLTSRSDSDYADATMNNEVSQ